MRLGGTLERSGGGGRGPDYDQSFINVGADQAVIMGCTLKGESWQRAPTAFIEARCGSLIVANNSARRLQVFANLTHNRHSRPHDRGLVCSGNLAEVCRRGIQVPWPIRQESVPAGGYVAGSGVHVVENTIHHRWTEYRWDLPRLTGIVANMSAPAAAGPGVALPGPATYDVDDRTIAL